MDERTIKIKTMRKDLQWFKDRVGKRVYRLTPTTCKCSICLSVLNRGLIIDDDIHAQYLFDCQNEMELIYEDSKNETNEP